MQRLILSLSPLLAFSESRNVTIANNLPRYDTNNQIVDGHDLSLRIAPDGSCK